MRGSFFIAPILAFIESKTFITPILSTQERVGGHLETNCLHNNLSSIKSDSQGPLF